MAICDPSGSTFVSVVANAVERTKVRRRSPLPTGWEYAYAYVFFVAVFLGQTVRFFVGSEPLIRAQPAQILIPLVAFLISAGLWLVSPVPIRLPSALLAVFFGLLIFIWLWALIRDWGATDLTAFTLGPFLVMLATKTPTPASAFRILNTLGVLVLILFASAALFAVVTDAPPTGFTTKWPPLTDPFDPIGMWWAPFNGPAEAGAIGAVLIVLGFGQRRWLSVPFVLGGVVILFYAGTLAAALGLGVALLILLFGYARNSPHKRRIQLGAATGALMGLAILIQELVRNPTLSSRTFIWSDFVALVQANPIWGWGSAALIESEATRTFPWGEARTAHGSDAHNLLFDAWVRYGLVGLLTLLAGTTLALTLAFRGWRYGQSVGPAIIVMTFVIGLTEHNVWWGVPSMGIASLLLGVLATGYDERWALQRSLRRSVREPGEP